MTNALPDQRCHASVWHPDVRVGMNCVCELELRLSCRPEKSDERFMAGDVCRVLAFSGGIICFSNQPSLPAWLPAFLLACLPACLLACLPTCMFPSTCPSTLPRLCAFRTDLKIFVGALCLVYIPLLYFFTCLCFSPKRLVILALLSRQVIEVVCWR